MNDAYNQSVAGRENLQANSSGFRTARGRRSLEADISLYAYLGSQIKKL